jgi:ribosome-associated translation inhibitor RaiA
MISFTYKHITQNEHLEIYTSKGIKSLTRYIGNDNNIQISFYREFDTKNKLKEIVAMATDINGESFRIQGKTNNFKKSVAEILEKFERQLKNSKNGKSNLQQSA